LNFLVFLSIGILLLYFAFKEVEISKLKNHLANAQYSWVFLSFFAAIISHIFRALRWRLLIRPLNYEPKWQNTFYALMTGYLANFALPRVGEVTRCATLSKKEKIPFDTLVGTVLIERGIDLITLLFITIAVFMLKMGMFGGFIMENIINPTFNTFANVFGFSFVIWIIIGISIITLVILFISFKERLGKYNFIIKLNKIVKGVFSGIKTVFHMRGRRYFLLYTVIIWIMYFFMSYFIFFAFKATSHLTILDGFFILVISSLAMSAPVQGGIGVYHVIVTKALILYEIPREAGAAFAVLTHESQVVMILLLGGFSFFMLFLWDKVKAKLIQKK
jgi:hypothetical protein